MQFPKIQKSRDAAMSLLSPSARDLEYGLGLHRDALVIDGYGFAAMGVPDNHLISKLVEEGASDVEIRDARENGMMTRWATTDWQFLEAQAAWEASGVDCVWINAGEESNEIGTLFKRLGRRSYSCEVRRDFCVRAYTPDDIVSAKEGGRHSLFMSANGVPMPKRFESAEDELSFIQPLFQLGVRMAHLVYQRGNLIGQGCGEPNDGGLTDFGRMVVAEMNRVGMIPDVAHAGLKTSLDAALCSGKPMVASHTVCRSLSEHCRAKTDEVMKAIAATGGYVGICCISSFLGGTCDIQALLDHIEYAVKLIGSEHVAIGTDVAYTITPGGEDGPTPNSVKRRKAWRSLWPDGSLGPRPGIPPEAAQSLAWTNFPMITVGLVQRGFSDDDIRNVLGLTCHRVAQEQWDRREP